MRSAIARMDAALAAELGSTDVDMPNGFEGSAADWRRLEAPLRSVDWRLWLFALRHMLPFSKNGRGGHEWPERSFRWGNRVSRLIQLYLNDPNLLSHNLWVCASEDRNGRRYWKQAMLRESVTIEQIAGDLPAHLGKALKMVSSWTSADLEPAGDVGVSKDRRAVEQ